MKPARSVWYKPLILIFLLNVKFLLCKRIPAIIKEERVEFIVCLKMQDKSDFKSKLRPIMNVLSLTNDNCSYIIVSTHCGYVEMPSLLRANHWSAFVEQRFTECWAKAVVATGSVQAADQLAQHQSIDQVVYRLIFTREVSFRISVGTPTVMSGTFREVFPIRPAKFWYILCFCNRPRPPSFLPFPIHCLRSSNVSYWNGL